MFQSNVFPALLCPSSTLMLGTYAGIFLLLLTAVLTCAVSSCGSVCRAFFQGRSGRAGCAGVVRSHAGMGRRRPGLRPGPHPWLVLPLG